MEWSLKNYEHFIYDIVNQYPRIEKSDLVVKQKGKFWAEVIGKIYLNNNITLEVREILDFSIENFIRRYGYAIRRCNKVLYWYDSQEHPNDPKLKSTHPHQKHVEPDIKHNRIPAPGLMIHQPNLHFVIEEIIKTIVK